MLNLLLSWFYFGESVENDIASAWIAARILTTLIDSGMLARDGSRLAPAVMLTPHNGRLFAADTAARWKAHAADLVIWPNPTTQLLDRFSIRKPFDSALDLGAGSGIQAVHAASHCRRVTATDLNPRAAGFTTFNAWLNGVENIECLTGDTFEPVRNRTFDLILANPPFFVTPPSDVLYCENSMDLDQYCRRIVTEAGGHLNEGGYAQIVLEWVQVWGQSWQERIEDWLADSGCDAWVFRGYARDAAAYAHERIQQSRLAADGETEAFERWMDYYGQRGVEEIHGGVLAMHRRTGRNWVRMEDLPMDPTEPFGDSVWQAFACIDCLELKTGDDGFLATQPRLSPDAQLDEQSRQVNSCWQKIGTVLRLVRGIPASTRLDPAVAQFLVLLDGRQTLGDVITAFSRTVPASPELVKRECLAVVRRLMESRFVLP